MLGGLGLDLVGWGRQGTVLVGFECGWGGVAGAVGDLAVEPAVVEPVDVFEGGELDVGQSLPGPARVDQLPLGEAVEALHECIVVGIALRDDRRHDRVVGQSLGAAQRGVVTSFRGLSQHFDPV